MPKSRDRALRSGCARGACRNTLRDRKKGVSRGVHAIDTREFAALRSRSRWLEFRNRGETESTRLARRDVVVAVGGRPIALVEDVLDIELHFPVLAELGINGGIDAYEAGQPHRVVGGGK